MKFIATVALLATSATAFSPFAGKGKAAAKIAVPVRSHYYLFVCVFVCTTILSILDSKIPVY